MQICLDSDEALYSDRTNGYLHKVLSLQWIWWTLWEVQLFCYQQKQNFLNYTAIHKNEVSNILKTNIKYDTKFISLPHLYAAIRA